MSKEELRKLCGKAAQEIQGMAEELDSFDCERDYVVAKHYKPFIDELYKASMERDNAIPK